MSLAIRVSGWVDIFASAIRFVRAVGAIKGGLSWHRNPDRQHDLRARYRPFHLLDFIHQGCDLGLDC